MSLLDFVRRIFTTRPRQQPHTPPAIQHHQAEQSRPTTHVEATRAVAPNPPQAQPVVLHVYYRDEATDKQLAPAAIISGRVGDHFEIDWRRFPGRRFTRIENYSDVFVPNAKDVNLYYQEIMAAPVTVYHRGTDGLLLAPPEIHYGTVDLAYVVNALSDRRADVQGATEQRGVFTTSAQTVRFTYHPAGLETGTVPDAAYVEIMQDKSVHPHVRSKETLRAPLPKGSIWQVFGLVREEDSKHVWLNLGGSQWITSSNTRPHKNNPYLPAPIALQHAQVRFTTTNIKLLNNRGRIVGPAAGCSLWSAPYGTILPRHIANGTLVNLAAKVFVSDGSEWYRLGPDTFVQASYVSFNL
ncbi:MucBP domain-containing protein [Lacticaseibacillus zhaodongensis]|uniref:MucBP domain-containing protein n=1 Tax=Lacticaseibacillus zhaodongensis TaxID=2668065 RepID=UPI0012D3076E|nr:MucBP domain-containing protein [Lacticaseibacillus zhaodongensis]